MSEKRLQKKRQRAKQCLEVMSWLTEGVCAHVCARVHVCLCLSVGVWRGQWCFLGATHSVMWECRVSTVECLPAIPWGPQPRLLSIPSVEPQPVIIHPNTHTHMFMHSFVSIHTGTCTNLHTNIHRSPNLRSSVWYIRRRTDVSTESTREPIR